MNSSEICIFLKGGQEDLELTRHCQLASDVHEALGTSYRDYISHLDLKWLWLSEDKKKIRVEQVCPSINLAFIYPTTQKATHRVLTEGRVHLCVPTHTFMNPFLVFWNVVKLNLLSKQFLTWGHPPLFTTHSFPFLALSDLILVAMQQMFLDFPADLNIALHTIAAAACSVANTTL